MGVQVIENWSLVEGSVVAAEPHQELTGYVKATVRLLRVSAVAGYADLFSAEAGRDVAVNVPASKAAELGLAPGTAVRMRIRKAGPASAFADPDSIVKAD